MPHSPRNPHKPLSPLPWHCLTTPPTPPPRLCSGGGSLGTFHMGVVKALHSLDALPRVFSGASAGAIVCAIICTRTDEELTETLKVNAVGGWGCAVQWESVRGGRSVQTVSSAARSLTSPTPPPSPPAREEVRSRLLLLPYLTLSLSTPPRCSTSRSSIWVSSPSRPPPSTSATSSRRGTPRTRCTSSDGYERW